ncbi:alkaline-phosphatase-like protein [Mucor mucedo]|uniref:alkaline-phosphatase-like protein n=1 Tax=Mucor mucedo TaxID=29922 RepID=UPI00221E8B92|nr:alkaline-phosphatase-like protein [Mucor mucedo]KAI7894269.1 alkaline-phosphatase-like protein [Mucor mucedo]
MRSKFFEKNEDEETLLPKKQRQYGRFLLYSLFCVAGIILVSVQSFKKEPRRNVIMMVSDGFGPASETFARQYYSWKEDLPVKAVFPLDKIMVGQSRTQSSSSLITDSAAGATAFACALKSYNGAIGVDPQKVPCGTVLESAKLHRHMKTGLVVKSRITHATPASFSAHVNWRDWENTIAEQQVGYTTLGRTVDLMFGGGLCHFLSNATEGSCRTDELDLLTKAKEDFGWQVKSSREAFDDLDEHAKLPLLGLFANDHMDYAIDNDPSIQPSLPEMTQKALAILKKSSKKHGFFLMVEGSRIDMAGHNNDPAAHFHEIWEYQETVKAVLKFAAENPGTVVISTSDHETGGLTVGRQTTDTYPEYEWNPQVLDQVRNSSEVLGFMWAKAVREKTDTKEYLLYTIIEQGLGIKDTTEEELAHLWAWKSSGTGVEFFIVILSDLVSKRAQIGWTTMGHTAVDVNLYAYGHQTETLRGNHENTEIGDFIVDYLGLNLEDITKRLIKGERGKSMTTKVLPKWSKHDLHSD